MTKTQILGAFIAALPLIAFTVYMIRTDGWRIALGTWATAIVSLGIVSLGVHLFLTGRV